MNMMDNEYKMSRKVTERLLDVRIGFGGGIVRVFVVELLFLMMDVDEGMMGRDVVVGMLGE